MAAPLPLADPSTRALVTRLWREELSRHKPGILAAMLCTLALSAITALYPIVIQQAFDRFSRNDPSVVWLLPPLIIAVTASRAAALYGQQLAVQGTVLRVIEGLQRRLFAALTRADLAVAAAEAPARNAARFRELYSSLEGVYVPEVVDGLTTARVRRGRSAPRSPQCFSAHSARRTVI